MSPDCRARSRPDRTSGRRPSALASHGRSLARLAVQTRSSGGPADAPLTSAPDGPAVSAADSDWP
eukprot:13757066-Alexandrium_andersonii.AAC.1